MELPLWFRTERTGCCGDSFGGGGAAASGTFSTAGMGAGGGGFSAAGVAVREERFGLAPGAGTEGKSLISALLPRGWSWDDSL